MSKSEYELYTRVRLRDFSVATIVDRLGPDYIVDIGNNATDWKTIKFRRIKLFVKLFLERNI